MKEIRWISSGEYLPSYGQEVITLGPKGGMLCGFYRHVVGGFPDRWEWPGGGVRRVRWWMPREMLPPMPVDGQSPIRYCEVVAGEAGHARDDP